MRTLERELRTIPNQSTHLGPLTTSDAPCLLWQVDGALSQLAALSRAIADFDAGVVRLMSTLH